PRVQHTSDQKTGQSTTSSMPTFKVRTRYRPPGPRTVASCVGIHQACELKLRLSLGRSRSGSVAERGQDNQYEAHQQRCAYCHSFSGLASICILLVNRSELLLRRCKKRDYF